MMPEPKIQNDLHRRFSSGAKYILLHLNNYRFSKNNPDSDGPYIHREHLENRLESWLLNSSKSGSYLVSGYRGMGKSSLVDKVLSKITKELHPDLERWWNVASLLLFMLSAVYVCHPTIYPILAVGVYLVIIFVIAFVNTLNRVKQEVSIDAFPNGHIFSKEKIRKILSHFDKREQSYRRISIKINLGKEVLNAKDVMCLIATHIRNRYREYLDTRHNRPLIKCFISLLIVSIAVLSTQYVLMPIFNCLVHVLEIDSFFICVSCCSSSVIDVLIRVSIFALSILLIRWGIRLSSASLDKSHVCLNRLNYLADWITSEINEERKINMGVKDGGGSPVSFTFGKHRGKKTQIATIRDIEAELIDIINTINSLACLPHNRVQFIIVLDELDKIEQQEEIKDDDDKDILTPPEFTTTVNGFSNNATNNERKNVVLHILGNMKLFLTTANAKFIFISGREMFDAYLADASDREYAISSIFSGVINVNSFLYPDREQSDVGSLTEQYLAEILIPEDYLWQQTLNNAIDNKVLKREAASLRWYTQYLTELVDQENLDREERRQRIMEIRHIVTFLHDFIAYLSHVSKGAPKKIVLHLDEYVRRCKDCVKLYDWDDHMEYGKSYYSERKYNVKKPKGVQQDYVLYFTPQDQQKIGFISYLTAPLKNVLINSVSNYNDKLLIEASFLIDHLFKFHGRGFSWRNIEQTPELLDVSKTSDLGDFITSIMEFMQQQHLTPIMVGLYKYKFRKRISEEIAYISRISDEAAALFNFTLNESKPTRQYNIRLLNYYMKLNAQVGSSDKQCAYYDVMSRIHATLADLYFLEENYARALQEYRNSISLLDQLKDDKGQESSTTTITRLRNTLKMALTCEYSKNYETAYAIYCNLVDKMISVREVDERTLGLALVNTWTDDWRIKQPMIVDPKVRKKSVGNYFNKRANTETIDTYYHLVYDLMWDDGYRKDASGEYGMSEYSLNFENLISGFAQNLSPEKSNFIAKLSLFEDIRLVYKAILAKLFIVEKMNMSGITLSNIETAEAEFKYLHRTTNLKEKFFVSADFFNELGKILYYKNNITLISANNNYNRNPLNETFKDALYWCDIDLYAYLDEFCFHLNSGDGYKPKYHDAKIVKDIIRTYYDKIIVDYLCGCIWNARSLDILNCTKCLFVDSKNNAYQENIAKPLLDRYSDLELTDASIKQLIYSYNDYVINKNIHSINLSNIYACHKHRKVMLKSGHRPPCHACKYTKRSMNILMDYMFVDKRDVSLDRLVFLLQNSFYKNLRLTRVNHIRLLASNIASMGNIMFSCADSPMFSFDTIEYIAKILGNGNDKCKDETTQEHIKKTDWTTIGRIDKALLYHLIAFRYYSIAKLDKDACDCLLKILIIINNALTVAKSNPEYVGSSDQINDGKNKLLVNNKSYKHIKELFDTLFTRYAKLVNRQGAYSEYSEVHSIRGILHMHNEEDINLTRSHLYSDLVEALWHIIDSEIKVLDVIKLLYPKLNNVIVSRKNNNGQDVDNEINIVKVRNALIIDAYNHFKYIGMPHNTFYSEVICYFARYNINNYILNDILKISEFRDNIGEHKDNNESNKTAEEPKFEIKFLQRYYDYMSFEDDILSYDSLFNIGRVTSKPGLIEFLIEDSIICLSEILYILTPFNHVSSFSNHFIAEIYHSLWRYAKMYETLGTLYDFKKYEGSNIYDKLFEYWGKTQSSKNADFHAEIRKCCYYISEDVSLRDMYGSLRNRMFTRLKHNIDDRTVKYTISNYAAEMALRYYSLIESSYYEGTSYRNQISRNYLLNDDLDNDTWLFNTAIERFRINTSDIEKRKQTLAKTNATSRFYRYDSYVLKQNQETEQFDIFDEVRFDDSLFTNTEL
mgnify:CR=1 FL=1